MSQAVLRIEWLPASAIDAAAEFHEAWLDEALHLLEDGEADLAIVMPPAPYDHADWRRAAVRDLARESAPQRVNLVAASDEGAIDAALGWLAEAPGITGQYLPLDPVGAGNPVAR